MRAPACAAAASASVAAAAAASTRPRVIDSDRAAPAVGRHEGVAVVGRRYERLLDRARAHPADQVPHRAGLVVRTGGARAAEGLLAYDGAGRLVVDVEVASRIAQLLAGQLECVDLAREHRARQAVRGALVDHVERLAVLALR